VNYGASWFLLHVSYLQSRESRFPLALGRPAQEVMCSIIPMTVARVDLLQLKTDAFQHGEGKLVQLNWLLKCRLALRPHYFRGRI
jgi:hypothetical protein